MNKVAVLGHNYLARLSIIRALGEYGHDITVLTGDKDAKIDSYSRYVKRVLSCPFSNRQLLVNMLLEECADKESKTILIPTSDVTVSIIDEHHDELKDFFLFPHINHKSGQMLHWMDKTVQKELARKIGMNVAESWIILIEGEKFKIPDDIIYPCFVKPQITIHGGKSTFKRCDNKSELEHFVNEVAQKRGDIQLLVEEFLEINNEYAVVGFSDGENVFIPGVIYLEQISQTHFGVARLGKVLPIGGFRPFIEQVKEYVRDIGYVGLFDIDFFECQGKYYFCEMNLRFGGSGDAITKMGVNLPVMLVEKLSAGQIQTLPSLITAEATFMNERVCLDDWYRGNLTEDGYRRIREQADFGFLDDKNDPDPLKAFQKYKRHLKVKKHVKHLLGLVELRK